MIVISLIAFVFVNSYRLWLRVLAVGKNHELSMRTGAALEHHLSAEGLHVAHTHHRALHRHEFTCARTKKTNLTGTFKSTPHGITSADGRSYMRPSFRLCKARQQNI